MDVFHSPLNFKIRKNTPFLLDITFEKSPIFLSKLNLQTPQSNFKPTQTPQKLPYFTYFFRASIKS